MESLWLNNELPCLYERLNLGKICFVEFGQKTAGNVLEVQFLVGTVLEAV